MSNRFGDDTARLLGRITLNPVAHIDPIGTLLIPIVGFIFGSMGGPVARIPADRLGQTDAGESAALAQQGSRKRDGVRGGHHG